MCVAVPGRVVAVADDDGVPTATVVVLGAEREINCSFLPDVAIGDRLVTHSGFAVRRVTYAEALETERQVGDLGGVG